MIRKIWMAAGAVALAGILSAAEESSTRAGKTGPVVVDIDLEKQGAACPKTLWGIFFEDINYAADGGLYPELLANRGFDWQTKELEGWERDARGDGMARITRQYGKPVHEATATHLRIEAFGAGEGVGVRNRGYHGMYVEAGKKYTLSFYARGLDGYKGNLRAVLEAGGRPLCSYTVKNDQLKIGAPREGALFELPDWTRFETVFTPNATADDATFSILLDQAGAVELEQVSLFPQDTFNGRKNGLRKDLVQKLKDLKPGVFRFPGGCLTEGRDWPLWYDWKLSVGDGTLESRSCIWNTWGYWQSMGLGYYEYFCLCEDIGAEPLPVMNGGITCQFAKPWDIAPLREIDYFTKNFCDLIEFANGDPATTKWGALRAKMDHPKPFNLKYLGIGNENWDEVFVDRYEAIAKELRKRHPEIRLVSSAGPGVDRATFRYAWNRITTEIADILDEHYYENPAWFFANANRYDAYPRTASRPKVYVGEYACHVPGRANNLYAALCEAALMAGFERNSDIVEMTSYAPLFCKIGGTQWKCDMIWYNNAQSFGTPSYYVQKLFSNNLPTRVVPSRITNVAGVLNPPEGRVALQTWKTTAEFKDIKVTALDGRTLFEGLPDPAKCSRAAHGQWSLQNGVLCQSAGDQSDTALRFGDATWRDYTFTFKARRTGGAEAFMAQVMVGNKGSRYLRVNLGGWDNKESAFENFGLKIGNPIRIPDSYELNRWYAIAIRVKGNVVQVDVDGKKKLETTVEQQDTPTFFQTCGYDAATNELVVKLVNVNEEPRTAKLNFGRALPAGQVKVQLLTGERGWVNSLEAPTKVSPREMTVDFPGGAEWEVATPASSLSVYRIKL